MVNNPLAPAGGANIPCISDKQHWPFYAYPGLITQHPTGSEDYSIRGKFKVKPGALLCKAWATCKSTVFCHWQASYLPDLLIEQ